MAQFTSPGGAAYHPGPAKDALAQPDRLNPSAVVGQFRSGHAEPLHCGQDNFSDSPTETQHDSTDGQQ